MIALKKVCAENRDVCCAMRVAPAQAQYIASNARSLEQAAEHPDVARPFVLYNGAEAVGFAMLAFDRGNKDADDQYWLWRLMIDEKQQGLGYGRAAIQAILAYFRREGADTVTLSTKPDNARALHLYHSFGFAENGQENDGETVLKYKLRQCM